MSEPTQSGERLARIIQEADAENPEWARGARFVLGWTKGPDDSALEVAFRAVRDPLVATPSTPGLREARFLRDIKDRDAQTEPTPVFALPLGQTGTKYDHARRPTSSYHLDSPDIAMGDRHYLLEIIAGRDPDADLPPRLLEPVPTAALTSTEGEPPDA